MIHATRRGVRRYQGSPKPSDQRRRTPTLASIIEKATWEKRQCRIDGHCRGHRLVTAITPTQNTVIFAARHPTKKATKGRYGFVEVKRAQQQEAAIG